MLWLARPVPVNPMSDYLEPDEPQPMVVEGYDMSPDARTRTCSA